MDSEPKTKKHVSQRRTWCCDDVGNLTWWCPKKIGHEKTSRTFPREALNKNWNETIETQTCNLWTPVGMKQHQQLEDEANSKVPKTAVSLNDLLKLAPKTGQISQTPEWKWPTSQHVYSRVISLCSLCHKFTHSWQMYTRLILIKLT